MRPRETSEIVLFERPWCARAAEGWVPTWVSNPGFAPNSCAQKIKNEIKICRVCFCFSVSAIATKPSFPNQASNQTFLSIQSKSQSRLRVESWVQTWVANPGFAPNSCAQEIKNEIEICRVCLCFFVSAISPKPSFPNPASNPARETVAGKDPQVILRRCIAHIFPRIFNNHRRRL